ncbi:50S ribosomal protein L23 [Patulibacter defluvii]|uniref:50S ribosomal protein L23 n=1 Tax=Patulibacter defluvii TaxID=3095358 RepID=UPI002A74DEBB|nr:50S ribosomal protein L23 [Patulibacter sp. DM4]
MDATQVIIRPVVSEKSYVLATVGKYTFRVHPDAHKTQIRQAVEALFDVDVVDVKTASVKSKPKRRGTTSGRTRSWKKAIVQVAEGQEIPIFQSLDLNPAGSEE